MELVYIIIFLVCFLSSIIGAICGIGGGVIIKPVIDTFNILSVPTVSFLSGCTVLAMSSYIVLRSKISSYSNLNMKIGTPLAIGAAFGGVVGKSAFQLIKTLFVNSNTIGSIQAACLLVITIGTLIYTIKKDKIKTKQFSSIFVCLLIGLILGIFSSFLGIGGGPINLVVLFYFFSMTTKEAVQNSLYIIFFSQLTSFVSTIITNSVPKVDAKIIIGMIICGVIGGIVGKFVNKKLNEYLVNKLFTYVMIVIIIINIYNVIYYAF